MNIITISNQYLTVNISAKGAEMQSILKDGRERLWQGDPTVWSGRAPLLFPICGGLKDDKFIFDGKEYTLPRHGFARHSVFETEEASPQKAVFLLRSNPETLKNYPFDFELRVIYTLNDSAINIEYQITNLSKGNMYFSIGSHEAYSCPEGVSNYRIIFEQPEDLIANRLAGSLVGSQTINLGNNTRQLNLTSELFEHDSLNFLNLKSRSATLENITTEEGIRVDFKGADYFLVWQKPGANYICLEPWCGIADFEDSDYDITAKPGIICLESNKTFAKNHSITF